VISGIVANGHPIITIPFRIPNRADFPIEFVVDTGFTDELCLPSEAVALLNLPFRYDMRANLADNSQECCPFTKQLLSGMVRSEKLVYLQQGGDPWLELLY
jgi:predicted aspartyl protease